MKRVTRTFAGLALIDSLIALLILSAGMVAISRFQNYIVRNATETKSHVEAQHLAREQLETFRRTAVSGDFNALVDTKNIWSNPQEITGNRAVYRRNFQIADTDWGSKTISVRVSWNDVENQTQSLEMSGVFSSSDPSVTGWIAEGAGNQRGLRNPSGGVAELRDHVYATLPEGVTDNLDGTYFYEHEAVDGVDGVVEVLDSTGKVQLVINTYPLTISGHVYYEGNIGNIIVFNSNYGHCVYFAESPVYFNAKKKKRFNSARYTCYIAAGWYGSVGIIGIASNEKGCPDKSRTFVVKHTDAYGMMTHRGVYQVFANQDFVFSKFTGGDPSCKELQADSGWNLDPASGTLIEIDEPAI